MSNNINCFHGTYRFLSNFFPSCVTLDEMAFPTVENAYQAAKCADPKDRALFIDCSPSEAKRLGRKIKMRPDWEAVKKNVMFNLLLIKFSEPTLKQWLLNTAPAELIEGNTWHDNYWGYCTCGKCADKQHTNMLGKLIMHVRKELTP